IFLSAVVITVLMFIVLFVFLFLGLPVALGLGGTAVVFAMIFEPRVLMSAPSQFFSTPWQHIIVTVPLFIFMGNIIRFSVIAENAYDADYIFIGQFQGGIAVCTVDVCMIFVVLFVVTLPETISLGQ